MGILEELDLKGYQHIGGPEHNDKKIELSAGYALEHDHDVRLGSASLRYSPSVASSWPCANAACRLLAEAAVASMSL